MMQPRGFAVPILLCSLLVATSARAEVDPAILEALYERPVVLTLKGGSEVAGVVLGSARGKVTIAVEEGRVKAIPLSRVDAIRLAKPVSVQTNEAAAPEGGPSDATTATLDTSGSNNVLISPQAAEAIGQRVRLRTFDGRKETGTLVAVDHSVVQLTNAVGQQYSFPTSRVKRLNLLEKVDVRNSVKSTIGWTLLAGGNLVGLGLMIWGLAYFPDCSTWGEDCGEMGGLIAGGIALGAIATGVGLWLGLTSTSQRTRTVEPPLLQHLEGGSL